MTKIIRFNMTTSTTSILKKLLILFLIIAGLYYAKAFIMPLAIAGVVATLFLPFCRWMEEMKVPKGLAVLVCLLVLLLVLAGIGALLGWQISELTNDSALLKQKAINIISQIQEYININLGISNEKQSQLLKSEQPPLTVIVQMIAGSLAKIVTNFILVLAYIFLLLYYRRHIFHFIVKLAQLSQQKEMEQVVRSIAQVSQDYLLGLTKMIICLWIMYGIGFSILGVKNALVFALICGLLEIIPFVGNITGTTLTILVAAAQGASILMLAGIVGVYILVQLIQGWILEPIILGKHVKINPFTTIIALVLGELIWGIPGVFLAIPLIAMVKIVCDHIESLKPYGFLIGEIKPVKGESVVVIKIKNWFNHKCHK